MGAGEKAGTWVVRYDSGIGPRYYVGPWASGGVQYTSERDHAKVFDSLAEARERARAASSKVYRVKPRAPEAFGDEVGPQHREQLEAGLVQLEPLALVAEALLAAQQRDDDRERFVLPVALDHRVDALRSGVGGERSGARAEHGPAV
jgi:hypothetical protein